MCLYWFGFCFALELVCGVVIALGFVGGIRIDYGCRVLFVGSFCACFT